MTSTFGKQLKLYADRQTGAKRTALDFQYVVSPGKDAFPTVNITMAPIADGAKEAQWELKRVIQLNRYELTQCCAVLFGLEKEMRANFHGTDKNKGFTLINNGASGCGINFSHGGDMLTHMLNHAQRMEVGAFILKRQADAWDMSVSDVLALLRQSVAIKRAQDHEAGSRTGLPYNNFQIQTDPTQLQLEGAMTEHQQNRNVCEVGLACEAMTIDPKTIQSAVMRKEATQVVIPHFKGVCPAFVEWAEQCLPGDKLPRGKFFRSREWMRQFTTCQINYKTDHPDEGKYGWLFEGTKY